MRDYIYYQRALAIQKKKIVSQAKELTRFRRIYLREVEQTEVLEAAKFLMKVIINKIKR